MFVAVSIQNTSRELRAQRSRELTAALTTVSIQNTSRELRAGSTHWEQSAAGAVSIQNTSRELRVIALESRQAEIDRLNSKHIAGTAGRPCGSRSACPCAVSIQNTSRELRARWGWRAATDEVRLNSKHIAGTAGLSFSHCQWVLGPSQFKTHRGNCGTSSKGSKKEQHAVSIQNTSRELRGLACSRPMEDRIRLNSKHIAGTAGGRVRRLLRG